MEEDIGQGPCQIIFCVFYKASRSVRLNLTDFMLGHKRPRAVSTEVLENRDTGKLNAVSSASVINSSVYKVTLGGIKRERGKERQREMCISWEVRNGKKVCFLS